MLCFLSYNYDIIMSILFYFKLESFVIKKHLGFSQVLFILSLVRVPTSADVGIKSNNEISGDMCGGNFSSQPANVPLCGAL